jgi:tetratricopeptide (TPR) repeat protein
MSNRRKSSKKHVPRERLGTSVPAALPLGALAGAAAIAVVAFLVYFPSISGGFVLDDNYYLTDALFVKTSDGLYNFWCTSKPVDYWPASNTTFWIEWRLWGMHPTGYHVTNLILHIVESWLIWVILRKLCIPGAFWAAIIFTVHPVNVEATAWIAQRKDVTAMLFLLLSILWYIKHLSPSRGDEVHGSRHTPCADPAQGVCGLHFDRWYWLSLAAFVLAMLGKGSAAILPLLLLGIVWWMRPGGTVPIFGSTKMWLFPYTRRDFARIAPFFLVAAALIWTNVWFQTHGSGEVIRRYGFVERLLGAGGAVWFYLYKALFPIDLCFVYPQWKIVAGEPLWWVALAGALAVTAVLWRYRKTWARPLLFAWGFFGVALLPVLGFTNVGFMKYSLVADRYQHIAIIGVIALVSAGLGAWQGRARGRARRAAIAVAAVAMGTLAFLAFRQNGLYRDATTLYPATLLKNPDCWLVRNNLGGALLQTGRIEEAKEHLEKALILNPDSADAHLNLGVVLKTMGRYPEAIDQYMRALALNPKDPANHFALGEVLVETGRSKEAIGHYLEVLRLKPDFPEVYFNLALAYANIHQSAQAVSAARKALELARSKGQTAPAKKIEDWLKSYQSLGDRGEGREH